MLNRIIKVLKALNSNEAPWQISLGIIFGKILKTDEAASKDLLSQATEKALLGNIPGTDSLLKKFKLPF